MIRENPLQTYRVFYFRPAVERTKIDFCFMDIPSSKSLADFAAILVQEGMHDKDNTHWITPSAIIRIEVVP